MSQKIDIHESINYLEFPVGSRFHFLDVSGNEFAVWTKE